MRDQLRRILASYEPARHEPEPHLPLAGVLILLQERPGGPHVIFQKRTDRVRDHKGQISFPGGVMDPGDLDIRYTALRETHEEVGVHPDHVDVLGELDQIVTVSNFLVTPFVGWLDRYPYEWRFSSDEVAYLLEVPLDHLRDPRNFVPDRRIVNGQEYTFQAYQFGNDLIWGATARMLSNLLDVLRVID